MKHLKLSLLCGASLLLSACGGSSDSDHHFIVDEGVPLNNIEKPVVRIDGYSKDDLSDVAAESSLMTYKMLGVDGAIVDSTALVFIPKTLAPKGGWKIVAWAHGTTGVADPCAPSQQGLQGTEYLLKMLLAKGYVVVAPDYEGLGSPGNHPFLNLKSEAFSITDAVVATRAYLAQQGKAVSEDWLSVGHSQGGQAALGAAEYHARAQLNYKGTIAIAPSSNIEAIFNGTHQALVNAPQDIQMAAYSNLDGFVSFIVAGMQGHKINVSYNQVFKPDMINAAQKAESLCLAPLRNELLSSATQYVAQGKPWKDYGRYQDNFLTLPVLKNFFEKDSQPLTAKVHQPVYIYQGALDQTVPQAATDSLVQQAKAKGSDVRYVTGATWDHISVYVDNLQQFTQDVQTLMPNQ